MCQPSEGTTPSGGTAPIGGTAPRGGAGPSASGSGSPGLALCDTRGCAARRAPDFESLVVAALAAGKFEPVTPPVAAGGDWEELSSCATATPVASISARPPPIGDRQRLGRFMMFSFLPVGQYSEWCNAHARSETV